MAYKWSGTRSESQPDLYFIALASTRSASLWHSIKTESRRQSQLVRGIAVLHQHTVLAGLCHSNIIEWQSAPQVFVTALALAAKRQVSHLYALPSRWRGFYNANMLLLLAAQQQSNFWMCNSTLSRCSGPDISTCVLHCQQKRIHNCLCSFIELEWHMTYDVVHWRRNEGDTLLFHSI